MMNSDEILSLYETVSDITDQMLTAAKSRDWEQLVLLESQCAGHVQTLENEGPPVALTGIVRQKKVQIIHKILADDREIRNITQPWMAELSTLINSAGTERKLSRTYGANTSN